LKYEHVGNLMDTHFDMKSGDLLSPWLLEDRKLKEE
jgi:hypothetical protein